MMIIVGLGNPGKEYENTRHNVGFMFLDHLSRELDSNQTWKIEKKFNAEIFQSKIKDTDVMMVKPLTFMNNSGEAVQKILHFYKVDPKDMLVVYDDVDLPLGSIRIRLSGSAGTHNGMKSLVQHLGTETFPRFRIGIESRGDLTSEKQEIVDFVLGRFTPEEQKILKNVIPGSLKLIETIEKDGIQSVNSTVKFA